MTLHGRRRVFTTLLLLATASAGPLTAPVTAQGPVYRERWGYLHLENRRAEVQRLLVGRDADDVAKVSGLLAGPDDGVPFAPVARALAHLRGVEADAAFVLRATVGLYVLPEVVDPDSRLETCREANFSVFLPFVVEAPGELTFALRVLDGGGAAVFEHTIERNTSVREVRLGQPQATMPVADLPDGRYEVEVATLIDGEGPRRHDPSLRWTFHVLRGYQARVEAAFVAANELRGGLEPLPRALLDGLALQVSRAYGGEAFAVRSDAVRELELLEGCVANLEDGRAPLAGLEGDVAAALPVDDELVQPFVLRRRPGDGPRPLVVFASGAPGYDVGTRRPTAPINREAQWLARELGDFGAADGWNVAVCDSPGGGRPYAKALLAALDALPRLTPTGGPRPLLVCDREAASIVGLHAAQFVDRVSGLVLVGGGAMPTRALDALGDLPVRMVSLAGYPGTAAIDRLLAFVAARAEKGDAGVDLAPLHDRALPWPFGVVGSLDELRQFARGVFARN